MRRIIQVIVSWSSSTCVLCTMQQKPVSVFIIICWRKKAKAERNFLPKIIRHWCTWLVRRQSKAFTFWSVHWLALQWAKPTNLPSSIKIQASGLKISLLQKYNGILNPSRIQIAYKSYKWLGLNLHMHQHVFC